MGETLYNWLDASVGRVIDLDIVARLIPGLIDGTIVTGKLMGVSLVLGMALALILAAMRLSGHIWLNAPAYAYIFFFRGTPLLVQIFLIYYGLSQIGAIRHSAILWPILREPFYCAIAALALNTAAYTAEIIRGAVLSVPANEIEAARAIGMSRLLTLRRSIRPHALRLSIPAYANEVILLLKGSALVSTITIMDITGVAQRMYARTYAPFEPLITAGLFYLVITFAITQIARFAAFMNTAPGRKWRKRQLQRIGLAPEGPPVTPA